MTNKIKVNELKDKKKQNKLPVNQSLANTETIIIAKGLLYCHVAIDQKPPIAASLLHVTQKINNGV